MKLSKKWMDEFRGSFETQEEVIEFIYDCMDTSGWENSYIDVGGHGEPNEMVKVTAAEKKQAFYDFMMSLIEAVE